SPVTTAPLPVGASTVVDNRRSSTGAAAAAPSPPGVSVRLDFAPSQPNPALANAIHPAKTSRWRFIPRSRMPKNANAGNWKRYHPYGSTSRQRDLRPASPRRANRAVAEGAERDLVGGEQLVAPAPDQDGRASGLVFAETIRRHLRADLCEVVFGDADAEAPETALLLDPQPAGPP